MQELQRLTLNSQRLTRNSHIALYGLPDIPQVKAGDDIVQLILDALELAHLTLSDGDVIVVTHKIVSKAEGCAVRLADVEPSPEAQTLAVATDKDPRLVEVIRRGSRGVVRQREGTLIMETRHGWICANAGVDRSNVAGPEGDIALTLPEDPDASARRLRDGLMTATGADIAVIISDTHGRAWRLGTVNVAIGVAGMLPISDLRGQPDMFGYTLRVTTVARADELAAAAGLVTGQAAEGLPVVLIRGAAYPRGDGRATEMQRPPEKDLFR
ncbi:MAG TPA: coenzyme F420-0:L-glutamate ligase [Anaerolineae bacterium]|nr:coenzyme F420-0:L-glutamate ligase [Anaerolineae bacterium]HQI83719.1 coenzyme F420-0:L-glutamate ligase [Anaerolineae bacterium]